MSYMDSFNKSKSAPAKKPGLMVAIGVGKAKPPMSDDSDNPMSGEGDDGGDGGGDMGDGLNAGERAAANAAWASLKTGDKAGFGMALKQLVQACSSSYDKDDDSDSDAPSGMMGQ